jgi:hypothetical protein
MDSALSLLNSLTTSEGLCYNQVLEEPVGPVVPSRCHCPRNRLVGTPICQIFPRPFSRIPLEMKGLVYFLLYDVVM